MNILVFIFGMIIGSFLNVCIFRIPNGQDIVTTPSHCPSCEKKLYWIDLIPVISYILLKGRCRHCQAKISMQYPMVELLNAILYVTIFQLYGFSVQMVGYCFFASNLIVIAFIDYRHRIIPNGIVLILLITGIIFKLLYNPFTYMDSIIGFFCASVPMLMLSILFKGGLGGGDIKLMAVVGIFLGWKLTWLALFIASIIGSIIGIVLIMLKKKDRKAMIPFGPFLSLGIMISMLYGQYIISFYLNLF